MAEEQDINEHTQEIRKALEGFVNEHHGDSSAGVSVIQANEPPKVKVTPSGLTEDIHAVVYVPEFDHMHYGDRQRLVWDYLKARVSLEHLKHLSLLRTVDSEEWEELPGLPPLDWLTFPSGV